MAPNQQPPHPEREEGERRAPTIRPRPPRRQRRRKYDDPQKKNDPIRRKTTGFAEPQPEYSPARPAAVSARAAEMVQEYDVIIAPVISEKSYRLIEDNVYTFVVRPDSNKTQIKIAVERRFNVKVASVNTSNRQGKRVRTRQGYGQRKTTKRAIVTLAAGSKPIELFTQNI